MTVLGHLLCSGGVCEVCTTPGQARAAEGTCTPSSLGSMPRSIRVPGLGGLGTPRSPGPWPSVCPALFWLILTTTQAHQWPVRGQHISFSLQVRKVGLGEQVVGPWMGMRVTPWVDLNCNFSMFRRGVYRAPFALLFCALQMSW